MENVPTFLQDGFFHSVKGGDKWMMHVNII